MTKNRKDRYVRAGSQTPGGPRASEAARRVRTDPIRVTLDLAPSQHRELKRWCNQAAADHDLTSVPLARVLRLLGEELVADEELADRIGTRLEELEAEEG